MPGGLGEVFNIPPAVNGKGRVIFRWDPTGKLLATCGLNKRVHIFDRRGELTFEFPLTGEGPCLQLAWDSEGDMIAAVQQSNEAVFLFSTRTRQVTEVHTNMPDACFLLWARSVPVLAIGTRKGNLLLYNKRNFKKIPVLGKHTKEITCGAWTADNKLVLGSMDRSLSISDESGSTVRHEMLKSEATDIQLPEARLDEKTNDDRAGWHMALTMARKSMQLLDIAMANEPVQLNFQSKYGDVVSSKAADESTLLIGFSKGYVTSHMTNGRDPGDERRAVKMHEELFDISFCPAVNKVATCGPDGLKLLDLADWKEIASDSREFSRDEGSADKLGWTRDGQLLSVSTSAGFVFSFLMSVPVINAHSGPLIAHLSSLRQVTVTDTAAERGGTREVELTVEPQSIALGPTVCAAVINNHAWFYSLRSLGVYGGSGHSSLLNEREYLATVKQMYINGTHVCALLGGQALLHSINADGRDEEQAGLMFPAKDNCAILSAALTDEFLIYSTDQGSLYHFHLPSWTHLNERRFDVPLRAVYPNRWGTRIVCVDENNKGLLYTPFDDAIIQIEKFPAAIDKVVWDIGDSACISFAAVDSKVHRAILSYAFRAQSVRGPAVTQLSTTKLPATFSPLLLLHGFLHGQKSTGSLMSMALSSHDGLPMPGAVIKRTPDKLRQAFMQYLALGKLADAWAVGVLLKNKDLWSSLAKRALELLEVEIAVRVYREMGDAAMCMALQKLEGVEERTLLAGHLCVLLGDHQAAQDLFLQSSQPTCALEMRRDLLQWNHALTLANKLAPGEVPGICREYAQQLEFKGEYSEALAMYEKGVVSSKDPIYEDHNRVCTAGIARTCLRVGDTTRGRALALQSQDRRLMQECASILESAKLFPEAAELYVRAESFEKGASIYIQIRDFAKAGPIMSRITAPKLHALYAKAKEAEKNYEAAEKAYEMARDLDSVVRLNLIHLNNPQKAFDVARKLRSPESAALVADFCQNNADWRGAIEFMLLAKRSEDAFRLAQAQKEMETYAKALGEDGTTEEYLAIATYFEKVANFGRAGDFYAIIGDLPLALRLYIQGGDSCMNQAIALIQKSLGKPESPALIRTLHEYLLGDLDGKAHDPNFILSLYMAIGDYKQAASTAVVIASTEQSLGNYKVAHGLLFNMHVQLNGRRLPVPEELRRLLLVLHSYMLVKKLVKRDDHGSAARMLLRVCNNISKFPAHIVPILTSTVIECHRAGLKRSAFEQASMLMRPEYRQQIDAKYKKKIETLVRHPPQSEEDEPLTPCPYCDFSVPESALDCPSCRNSIPYCIASGKHMVLGDWSKCPSCQFPALATAFAQHCESESACPMCNQAVNVASVERLSLPQAKEQLLNSLMDPASVSGMPSDSGRMSRDDGGRQSAIDAVLRQRSASSSRATPTPPLPTRG